MAIDIEDAQRDHVRYRNELWGGDYCRADSVRWPCPMTLALETITSYRSHADALRQRLAEIGECPFCGNSTGGEAEHGDGCELGPVEVCGKPIPDPFDGDTYPCRKRAAHGGACDD